ncbi:MAG: hypothetical protein HRU70_13835 [Phycisphaeraceae bacterium]|nr:MAG: hypothetical protein HRU70_13835 [Phycisphaeraceae bacterium]
MHRFDSRVTGRVLACGVACAASAVASAGVECGFTRAALTQATATYSQGCGGSFLPSFMIDTNPATGWALGLCSGGGDLSPTATVAFELSSARAQEAAGRLRVTVYSGGSFSGNMTTGRLRISVTGDNTNTFCDGLANNGDVTANWTVLTPVTATAQVADANGVATAGTAPTLTIAGDGSVVATGANPVFAIYTIELVNPLPLLTGMRVEFIDSNGTSTATDADGLPTGGPGRHPNGNTIVRTITLDTAPPVPVITSQPEDILACFGYPAGFGVATNFPGATFQWRKDGDPIPNATSSSYVDIFVRPEDAGEYDCVVTTPCGVLISEPAQLSLCAPDLDCDGFLDFFDFDLFLGEWLDGTEKGDYDGDGFIDFFDLDAYRNALDAGC